MTTDSADAAGTVGGAERRTAQRQVDAAAIAGAGVFAFLVLRIFAVSDFDWDTAFAVSTTLGLDDGLALVFGSLMAGHTLVAWLLVVVLPLLLADYLWGKRHHRPVLVITTGLGLLLTVAITVSFGSWWLPVGAGALLAVLALVRRLPARHLLRRASIALVVRAAQVAGVAVLVAAALIETPWVPREHIETTDGPLTGYVLSVDSGYLNVLSDDHEFVILLNSDVLSRE